MSWNYRYRRTKDDKEAAMSSSSGARGRILSVEDEPSIRQVCQRVLTSQGYQVDFAQNGVAAENMLMKAEYPISHSHPGANCTP